MVSPDRSLCSQIKKGAPEEKIGRSVYSFSSFGGSGIT